MLALGLAATLGACASQEAWETRLDADHPLVGRVWDRNAGAFIDPATLPARLADAEFVLLGEKHDNSDHQRLAARLVGEIAGARSFGTIGFEFLKSDRQAEIDAGARDLGGAFAPYVRIADAARARGARIAALNAPDALVRDVRTKGLDALDDAARRRLALDQPLDPSSEAAIAKDMRDSHCGMLPETAIPGMVAIQRLWDAHMAGQARAAAMLGDRRALLVVGANHARSDRGIPAMLARQAPGTRSLSLAFLEVAKGRDGPADYARNYDAAALPFDFVWFTPRASDGDPCAAFRRPSR